MTARIGCKILRAEVPGKSAGRGAHGLREETARACHSPRVPSIGASLEADREISVSWECPSLNSTNLMRVFSDFSFFDRAERQSGIGSLMYFNIPWYSHS